MEPEEGSSWVDSESEASESTSMAPSESESAASSRCSSTVSYEYDPNDFPKACEIEEFQSPSFEWPSSPALSRSQSEARPSLIQYNKLPKGVAAKMQTRMDHLNMLLSLSGSAGVLYNNTASTDIISNAQLTLDKASKFMTGNRLQSNEFSSALKETGTELEAAIANMSELLSEKVFLVTPIQLADLVAKTAGKVQAHRSSHGECQALKVKAERLARLLWKAAHTDLYERPVRRIMADTTEILHRALGLVNKYRAQGSLIRRTFINIPVNAIMEIPMELDNAINNISWLIRVSMPSASAAADNEDIESNLGLPPLAIKEPILCHVWKQVAKLLKGSTEDKAKAAAALARLTNIRPCGIIIVEQGGLQPLLKLVKEGKVSAQESAASALGLLSQVPECAKVMVPSGADACSIFTVSLKRGPLMAQGMVAWAVSELANYNSQRQDSDTQNDVVELLVEQLLCETNLEGENNKKFINANVNTKLEDSSIHWKVMAVRTLCTLASGDSTICRTLIDSGLMLHFPIMLDKKPEKFQSNTAALLLEIARVAEMDADLRCYAFDPSSPAVRAVLHKLMQIVQTAATSKELLVTCITALGCLCETFPTCEVVRPLVQLLNDWDDDVTREATIALMKFVDRERKKGLKPALLLLCYVMIYEKGNDELETHRIFNVLEWAATQRNLVQDAIVHGLLQDAREKLRTTSVGKWERRGPLSFEDAESDDTDEDEPIISSKRKQLLDEFGYDESDHGQLDYEEDVYGESDYDGLDYHESDSDELRCLDTFKLPDNGDLAVKSDQSPDFVCNELDYDELAARFDAIRRNIIDGL